jgi:predicted RNase H-like HicB family nuclease
MKLDVVVVKNSKTNTYTAFLGDYPAVCTQADSVDQLKKNLNRNTQVFFDYIRNKELELEESEFVSL